MQGSRRRSGGARHRERANGQTKQSNGESASGQDDNIVDNYRTILTELGVLTTVSVLLFGFLLTSPSNADFSTAEDWLFFAGMLSISSATLVFVLPIAYHRLEFPYKNWEKFQRRSHAFISVGFPMFLGGMYAALALSLWDLTGFLALPVAAVPIGVTAALFGARRYLSFT
jgi:hypothetical protein